MLNFILLWFALHICIIEGMVDLEAGNRVWWCYGISCCAACETPGFRGGNARWSAGFPLCWLAVCSLSDVHPWPLEVQGDLGMSLMLFGRKCHFAHPEFTNTHTPTPSGCCSELNELISCQWLFMAFILVCVPRINNGVFPEAECVNGSGIRIWKL